MPIVRVQMQFHLLPADAVLPAPFARRRKVGAFDEVVEGDVLLPHFRSPAVAASDDPFHADRLHVARHGAAEEAPGDRRARRGRKGGARDDGARGGIGARARFRRARSSGVAVVVVVIIILPLVSSDFVIVVVVVVVFDSVVGIVLQTAERARDQIVGTTGVEMRLKEILKRSVPTAAQSLARADDLRVGGGVGDYDTEQIPLWASPNKNTNIFIISICGNMVGNTIALLIAVIKGV